MQDPRTVKNEKGVEVMMSDLSAKKLAIVSRKFWFLRDGRLVLDNEGNPMRYYKNVPSTLSSQLEPWRQEALRRAHGMSIDE